MQKYFLNLCFLLAFSTLAAQTYTSVKSGYFNDCDTWGVSTIEQDILENHVVFHISPGHTITIPGKVTVFADRVTLATSNSRLRFCCANTSRLNTTINGTDIICLSADDMDIAIDRIWEVRNTNTSPVAMVYKQEPLLEQ